MENIDYNFIISDINSVIHRPPTADWNVKNLCLDNNFVMSMTIDGAAEYQIGGEILYTKRNDVFIFPPGNVRSGRADPFKPWSFISVNFNIKNLENQMSDLPFYTENIPSSLREKFFQLSTAWTGKSVAHLIKCRSLIGDILYELIISRQKQAYYTAHFKDIERARAYILENYNHPISIEQLAKITSLSESYFRKLFREIVGMSALQYITTVRINRARDLLAAGEANVTEAALLSGFKDVFYFSTVFKKIMGYPPSKIAK